jgi:Nucleotide-sugar transporter
MYSMIDAEFFISCHYRDRRAQFLGCLSNTNTRHPKRGPFNRYASFPCLDTACSGLFTSFGCLIQRTTQRLNIFYNRARPFSCLTTRPSSTPPPYLSLPSSFLDTCYLWSLAFSDLCGEIFSPDCWKLSIPAILFVVQNSLQFVATSNLPIASFQVTYQMKILTTAAFSVALLRKKLTPTKWLSLFFLAIGVGIVQIQQTTAGHVTPISSSTAVGSAHEFHVHVMSPPKRFRGSHSRLLHFRSFRNGPQRLESRALGSKRPIISFLPYTRSSPYPLHSPSPRFSWFLP